jgi:octaprenyl-diphosphate synthase
MLNLLPPNADLSDRISSELAQVERIFAQQLVSDLPCVNALADHLEKYRGKMLRPTLVLVSGVAASPHTAINESQRVLAAVVEMVHMATLVHDDVLDEQDVRRWAATINRLHGNEMAVMLGDYLISHAYHLCSSLNSQEFARLIARTTNTVCEGELLQLSNRNNWRLDEATYFDVIRRKTAALCGTSCRVGAMAVGADASTCDALEQYGQLLGTAFQIIDDVLDLAGDAEVAGKTLGKDLQEGELTLPLIRHLSVCSPSERAAFEAMLSDPTPAHCKRIGQILAAGDAIVYARQRAEALVDEARGHLSLLEDSPARASLASMAAAVIDRRA